MFKSIAVFLLTLLLVSCAGKPDFDVRKQIPIVEPLTTIENEGESIIIAVYDFIDVSISFLNLVKLYLTRYS